MKTTYSALILIATLAIAGCSRNADLTAVAQAAIPAPSEMSAPLYPPLQADAQDGAVFDYY